MVVLDASALLALTFGERGSDAVAAAIGGGAAMSTVNLAEAVARVVHVGQDGEAIARVWRRGPIDWVDFDANLATLSGLILPLTRHRGLSLGDRACLALAKQLRCPAVTADRAWLDVDVGVEIQLVR